MNNVTYFFIGLFVFLLLLVLYMLWVKLISYAFKQKDILAHKGWDKVPAKLLKIAFPEIGTRGPATAIIYSYVAEVQYSYTYNGQEYEGKDIINKEPLEDIGLIVWVNPKAPKESKICEYKSNKRWFNLESI